MLRPVGTLATNARFYTALTERRGRVMASAADRGGLDVEVALVGGPHKQVGFEVKLLAPEIMVEVDR